MEKENYHLLRFAALSFLIFALTELVAAYFSNSLSLLGDGLSMCFDAFSYFLNMYAEKHKKNCSASERIRLEIFIPLFSVLILALISGYIIYDSIGSLSSDSDDVDDTIMLEFSVINLIIDLGNIFYFYKANKLLGYDIFYQDESETEEEEEESKGNINMCSAYTHVSGDTLRSIAVMIAALLSGIFGIISSSTADAYAAIVVSVIILLSIIPLLLAIKAKLSELKFLKEEREPLLDTNV